MAKRPVTIHELRRILRRYSVEEDSSRGKGSHSTEPKLGECFAAEHQGFFDFASRPCFRKADTKRLSVGFSRRSFSATA